MASEKAELIQSKIEEGKLSVNEARILLDLEPISNAEVNGKALRKLLDKMKQSEPLITITLSDIDSVPEVYYKGEQIKGRVRVSFDWKTSSFDHRNNTYIHLEFFDDESERCNSKMIQHNHPLKERKFISAIHVGIGRRLIHFVPQCMVDLARYVGNKRIQKE